jgi:hypothetical protein
LNISHFFKDKNSYIVIAQRPNMPIILWAAASLASRYITDEPSVNAVSGFAAGALIVWAVLELISGASPFRRVLGAIVLAFGLTNLFN